jgi:uncharacterized protein
MSMPVDASIPAHSHEPAPVLGAERLTALDTLRGVALLGILLMNICGSGLAFGYNDPSVIGGATGANLYAWIITNLFFEGSMRTIFSMLFGAGVLLLTDRAERASGRSPASIYYRRTAWLIIFGLVDAYLFMWVGDILYSYGVAGLLLYPLRKLSARTLIILGVASIAVLTIKDGVYDYYRNVELHERAGQAADVRAAGGVLDDEHQQALAEWSAETAFAKPSEEAIQTYTTGIRGGFMDVLHANLPILLYFQFIDFVPNGLLDVLGMMLLGMGLYKLGMFSGSWSMRAYVATLAIGYGIGILVNAWEVREILRANFDFMAFEKTNMTYDLGRLGTGIGHIALVMIVCKLGLWPRAQARLAAVGQMALTNYLTQSIIQTLVFTGVGLALFGRLERAELYYVVLAIWILQLAWSQLWLRYFRFGPAEWLWRSLTYWKLQPMRIDIPAAAPAKAEA